MKPSRITETERKLGRSEGYHDLSPREQWAEDKRLGILDWDGGEQKKGKTKRTVPSSNFVGTLEANVDNKKMSNKDFRQFIRNTLPTVIYDGAK